MLEDPDRPANFKNVLNGLFARVEEKSLPVMFLVGSSDRKAALATPISQPPKSTVVSQPAKHAAGSTVLAASDVEDGSSEEFEQIPASRKRSGKIQQTRAGVKKSKSGPQKRLVPDVPTESQSKKARVESEDDEPQSKPRGFNDAEAETKAIPLRREFMEHAESELFVGQIDNVEPDLLRRIETHRSARQFDSFWAARLLTKMQETPGDIPPVSVIFPFTNSERKALQERKSLEEKQTWLELWYK